MGRVATGYYRPKAKGGWLHIRLAPLGPFGKSEYKKERGGRLEGREEGGRGRGGVLCKSQPGKGT